MTRNLNLSTLLFTKILLIACTSVVITGANQQNIVECDFFETKDDGTTCVVNKTGISVPDSSIQCDYDKFDDLNTLTLTGSLIEYLPVDLAISFPVLKNYFAKEASFAKIEKKFLENLKNLTFLVLQSVNCQKVDKNAFEDLENLEFLDLANSSIEYFHSETFKPLTNLRFLYLRNNNLEFLHPHAFDSLTNLRILSVALNKLATLNRQLFLNKTELRIIDGRNNDFVYLYETTFDGLKLSLLNLNPTENCSLNAYIGIDTDFISTDEVKQDIRDHCAGTDFQIYQTHAKMMEIFQKYGDTWNY